jgi:hypothetical protein
MVTPAGLGRRADALCAMKGDGGIAEVPAGSSAPRNTHEASANCSTVRSARDHRRRALALRERVGYRWRMRSWPGWFLLGCAVWSGAHADWSMAVLTGITATLLLWTSMPGWVLRGLTVLSAVAFVAGLAQSGLPWWGAALVAVTGAVLAYAVLFVVLLRVSRREPTVP